MLRGTTGSSHRGRGVRWGAILAGAVAIGLPLVAVPASSQAGASGGKSAKYIISSLSGAVLRCAVLGDERRDGRRLLGQSRTSRPSAPPRPS